MMMRITNKMINTNYLSNLNSNLDNLNNLRQKAAAGRSYLKASENPAAALKAYQVRQNLSRISLYQNNVGEAASIMTEVETAVLELNSTITSISENVTRGRSGNYSEQDRANIAEVLSNFQLELFDIANYRSADKYVFGGSKMLEPPFNLESGVLYYHGIDVNSNTGFDESSIYYDIGLGLKTTASGQIKEGTAFNISFPGSEVFGTGTDTNGLPNNIFNLVGKMIEAFNTNDLSNLDSYVDKLESIAENITVKLVDVGQKSSFLSFLTERLAGNEFNATKKQTEIECIDAAEAIVNFNTQETAYLAALAMGNKLLQYSLLDYMK
ncbi:MAG: hypothetical protein PHO24_06605 [Clostridia bacterium]|nr:hypothetical protein [Clostridia bacterium]